MKIENEALLAWLDGLAIWKDRDEQMYRAIREILENQPKYDALVAAVDKIIHKATAPDEYPGCLLIVKKDHSAVKSALAALRKSEEEGAKRIEMGRQYNEYAERGDAEPNRKSEEEGGR